MFFRLVPFLISLAAALILVSCMQDIKENIDQQRAVPTVEVLS